MTHPRRTTRIAQTIIHNVSASLRHRASRWRRGLVLLLGVVPVAVSAQTLHVEALGWLEGCWRTEGANGTEERWSSPEGGVMLGTGRSLQNGRAVAFEYLRIEADTAGGIALVASPSGQATTRFPMVLGSADEAVFENLAHDFPQRIQYVRSGDTLRARVETVGERARGFALQYARCPSAAPRLVSVALRVADLEAMTAFYREALGVVFEEADAHGQPYRTGRFDDVELKLVPIRDAPDFEGFLVTQLGFEVEDIEAVLALAIENGGHRMGPAERAGDRLHAAFRDPDGNTIELYQQTEGE